MAKDKKKKKKEASEGDYNNFSQLMGQEKVKEPKAAKGSGLSPGVSLGNPIDRSSDKLFLGTDYREVLIPERAWGEILADVEHWTILPFCITECT